MEDDMPTATLPEIEHRCPGCDMWTRHAAQCGACRQHDLLIELVQIMGRANDTALRAYQADPHKRIADIKSDLWKLSQDVMRASGVIP
jgi:hypothetical protein